MEPLTDRRPSAQRCHVGLRPCLVDKNEASQIKSALILLPLLSSSRDRGPELFGGQHAFLKLSPSA
jgi:hypothetical protein